MILEQLETRVLLDATIWNRYSELAVANADALPNAAAVAVYRNGKRVADADQIVISRDVDASAGFDFRQYLVIDSNGVMRLRHLDGDAPPREGAAWDDLSKEDPFGTSVKLGPGLIRTPGASGGDFFLGVKLKRFELITQEASKGVLTLKMSGKPVDGDGNAAPVVVSWTLRLAMPTNSRAEAELTTSATFREAMTLSPSHQAHAEAFRVAMFSSSNNTNPAPGYPSGTHDADFLRLLNKTGGTILKLNLDTAPRNQLLLAPGSPGRRGTVVDGWMQLNQRSAAPLNGDPPNISIAILPAAEQPTYRAQAFISQDPGTSHNDDNLGAWIGRSLKSGTIAAGTRFVWSQRIIASDAIITPRAVSAAVLTSLGGTATAPALVTAAVFAQPQLGKRDISWLADEPELLCK